VEMEPAEPEPAPRSAPEVVPAPEDDSTAPETAPDTEADAAEDAGPPAAEMAPEAASEAPQVEPAPDTEDAPGIGTPTDAAPDEAGRDAAVVPDTPETTPVTGGAGDTTETRADESVAALALDDDPTTQDAPTAPAPEAGGAAEEAAPEPVAPPAPEPDPRATTGIEVPDGAPEILPPEEAPLPDGNGDPAPEVDQAAPAMPVEEAPTPDPAPDPAPDDVPEMAPEIAPEIAPEAEPPTDMADAPTPAADVPEVVSEPEADAPAPDDETEAEAEDPSETVVTGRLPAIGAAPVADMPEAAPVPALIRNAIAFAGAGDQPLLAILLLDTGGERAAVGDLGNLPFPVTVAVDAGATDAEEAIAFYRDQGAEIMLTVPLPEGATAMDVEVSVEAYGPLLADAAAVLVEEDLGFQTLGDGAVQLGVNLAESGHGFVSYPAGLNTGHKAVLKEGVKAGLVFRDLDGAGQEGPVIRRFLDNAAFRARNEERVIVVARTRAETVQALLEWSLGTRAQTVTLAPISAVLEGG